MSGRGQQHVYTRSQVVQEYHHEMKLGSDDVRKIARAAASHGQSRALSCLQYCCSSGCRHSCRVPTRARAFLRQGTTLPSIVAAMKLRMGSSPWCASCRARLRPLPRALANCDRASDLIISVLLMYKARLARQASAVTALQRALQLQQGKSARNATLLDMGSGRGLVVAAAALQVGASTAERSFQFLVRFLNVPLLPVSSRCCSNASMRLRARICVRQASARRGAWSFPQAGCRRCACRA